MQTNIVCSINICLRYHLKNVSDFFLKFWVFDIYSWGGNEDSGQTESWMWSTVDNVWGVFKVRQFLEPNICYPVDSGLVSILNAWSLSLWLGLWKTPLLTSAYFEISIHSLYSRLLLKRWNQSTQYEAVIIFFYIMRGKLRFILYTAHIWLLEYAIFISEHINLLAQVSQEEQTHFCWFYMKHMLFEATSILNDWEHPLCNKSPTHQAAAVARS